jgi:hypothetical protein
MRIRATTPRPGLSAPLRSPEEDGNVVIAVALVRCDEAESAAPVFAVVPGDEVLNPQLLMSTLTSRFVVVGMIRTDTLSEEGEQRYCSSCAIVRTCATGERFGNPNTRTGYAPCSAANSRSHPRSGHVRCLPRARVGGQEVQQGLVRSTTVDGINVEHGWRATRSRVPRYSGTVRHAAGRYVSNHRGHTRIDSIRSESASTR